MNTLYKKADRADLDKKNWLAIIAVATEKKEATYFTALALTLDDKSKLDDCYTGLLALERECEDTGRKHRPYSTLLVQE